MAIGFAAVDKYIHDHIRDWMGELSALCAVPSVSASGVAAAPRVSASESTGTLGRPLHAKAESPRNSTTVRSSPRIVLASC